MKDTILINFTDLSFNEKIMVLEWRNHPQTRKWMYTQDEISVENHLNFIESLKTRDDKLYFILKKDENYIGVIDFYNFENDLCEFGLYSNPFLKIAGTGSLLMEAGLNYAFDFLKITKLKLEVFEENLRAQGLYERYGFKEVAEKHVDERRVICMELMKDMVE
jgi:UDP-4-amino-4,6-dideoxy-N-acetyl-beta-L-altrosamine N-acetyltransferase